PLTGSFVSRGGDAALVILTPARAEIDPAGGRALLADLDRAYREVRRSAEIPLDFKAVGGPIYAAQDEALLRGDLTRTAAASGLGALCLAHFGPLRELGQVLTVGVLVTLVTTVALGAAVLVAFPRRSAVSTPPRLWLRFGQPALEGTVGFAARRPVTVLAVS